VKTNCILAADPSLPGESGREKRARVYMFLAECLADEQRFNTMGRISTDVLGAYLDGDSVVSHELLHDALAGNAFIFR
jgi:hypothetical protein